MKIQNILSATDKKGNCYSTKVAALAALSFLFEMLILSYAFLWCNS